MLDTQTKRRIDDCRDILVGKLPDPKAQIEQITIGLIYKFMDDMDKEAVELGGLAKFFSDYKVPDPEFPNDRNKDKVIEFSKYTWDKLMHPKVTANEMLTLYSEAIEGMEKNPNIPQLFRDIFNNAYLPYKDPETLKLFLKTIGEFEYTHSEKLGDAFEYLLSVMGSQGDAGQFRTPRHIIDFLVSIVDPDKSDTILDPACGTAGFLISAYKHIMLKCSKDNKQGLNIYEYNKFEKKPFNNLGDKLTPDDRKKLIQNFVGYDISPDMVRLSLVNLYLHGFNNPHIFEYDTLSSEERWNDVFDVVLANPPFMSPKGGIRPHKKFIVQANKAEVLFTNYISEHLNIDGKAAIIIPNGVVSNGQTAFKQVRAELVKQNLVAVISLPSGVFNPYSPIKTSALILDKKLSKLCDEILFIDVENDGFDLGAQRRQINKDDLPESLQIFKAFKEQVSNNKPIYLKNFNTKIQLVNKDVILSEKDVALVSHRYGQTTNLNSKYEVVPLGDVLDYEQPTSYIVSSVNYDNSYPTPVLTAGKTFILGYTDEKHGIFEKKLPVIIFDDFTTATKLVDFPFKVKSSAMKILHVKKEVADIEYVYHVMQNIEFDSSEHKRYWISQYSNILIPLPPLEVQKEIVNKIKEVRRKIEEFENEITALNDEIKNIVNETWGIT
jgi:type I restriction enzyme M protein